jgi:hypothetical protein
MDRLDGFPACLDTKPQWIPKQGANTPPKHCIYNKMKHSNLLKILPFIVATGMLHGNDAEIFERRKWTSADGRQIEAVLIKAGSERVQLRMAKDRAEHSIEIAKLSEKDQNLITDQQTRAREIVSAHNRKVQAMRWETYWYLSRDLSLVPELALDELRLIWTFGQERDLGIFAVKFTPAKFTVATDKATATMIGSEGVAVKAKADSSWSFLTSSQRLDVRPKTITKGSTDRTSTAYSIGSQERLLFPNGRSISESSIGLTDYLVLSLDSFEPRRR